MPGLLRLHAESGGRASGALEVGADLVLHLEQQDVARIPEGIAADDHLRVDDRLRINRACRETLARWLDANRDALTVEDVPLGWIWEHELMASVLVRTLVATAGVANAIDEYRPRELSVPSDDRWTEAVARAAAPEGLKIGFRASETPKPLDPPGYVWPRPRGWRRLAKTLWDVGLPSVVRQDAVILFAYWHLVPLVDLILEQGGPRLAVVLDAVPGGRRRTVAAALSGGVVTPPSRLTQLRARRTLVRRLDKLPAPPRSRPLGFELDEILHDRFVAFGRAHGPRHLALARTYARAFSGCRRVVLPNDHTPEARAAVHAARWVGVPVLTVQNGVFLPAEEEDRLGIEDDRFDCLEESDEVAVWSPRAAAAVTRRDRPIHVVGFPAPTPVEPPRSIDRTPAACVLVLVQHPGRITALIESRMATRHAETAIRALTAALVRPRITLRPHPGYPLEQLERLRDALPDVSIEIDAESDIMPLLRRHSLCIGARSTATYQAALAGVPVVMLNLTGYDWKWPLGGETDVPVARSEAELVDRVAELTKLPPGDQPPGRGSLLEALGGDLQSGALQRLAALLAAPPLTPPGPGTSIAAQGAAADVARSGG